MLKIEVAEQQLYFDHMQDSPSSASFVFDITKGKIRDNTTWRMIKNMHKEMGI